MKIEGERVYFKAGFRQREIPCQDILWAYMRIEEVSAKMCCAKANFDMYKLVLWTQDGGKYCIPVSRKEEAARALADLKAQNEAIDTGYSKEKEERYRKGCKLSERKL